MITPTPIARPARTDHPARADQPDRCGEPRHRSRSRRRRIAVAAAALAVALGAAGGLVPAPLPGGPAPAGAAAVPAGTPGVTRYFGKGAYAGIRAAVAATPRRCRLSDDNLTALVMAPIFKEVSMAETPDAAPSPMTLSRWDEWTGVRSGANNLHANYGLYPFGDPRGTPYPRAYWAPGVGIFRAVGVARYVVAPRRTVVWPRSERSGT